MKKLSQFALLIFVISTIASSCKRTTDFEDSKAGNFIRKSGTLTSFNCNELTEHLKWIARGLAHYPKGDLLVSQINGITNSVGNDSNENSIEYLDGLFSFSSELSDTLDSNYVSHSYIPSALKELSYSSQDWITKIFIPHNTYSTSKPFVVMPERCINDSITDDSLYAYYLNAGQLDSLILNDDNEDLYYVWVVDIDNYFFLNDDWETDSIEGFRRKSGGPVDYCVVDGVCTNVEKLNPNCVDCYPTPKPEYELKITAVEVLTDESSYKERWLGGKYEFAVSFGLEDGLGTTVSPPDGKIIKWNANSQILRLKRKDVCRKTKGGRQKGNNCTSHIHYVDHSLYTSINPDVSWAKMPIIFFERDKSEASMQTHNFPMYELETAYTPKASGYSTSLPYYMGWQIHYVATSVDLYAMWQANSHNGSSVWIGNNEAKIQITLVKK